MDDQLLQAQACCDNKAPDDQSFNPAIEVPGKVTSAVSIVSATEEVDISPALRSHRLESRPQSEAVHSFYSIALLRHCQEGSEVSISQTSKGSPARAVPVVNLHMATALPAPHNKCTLSQKCSAFQPFDTSHVVQTAEDKYAQAKGADGASLAAHKAAINNAAESTAVAGAILHHAAASCSRDNLNDLGENDPLALTLGGDLAPPSFPRAPPPPPSFLP